MSSKQQSIWLRALGHYHPGEPIKNKFFDRLDIDSDAQWVEDRTGIASRHSVLSEDDIVRLRTQEVTLDGLRKEGRVKPIGDMAREAWEYLKSSRSGEAFESPDLVICGTSVPDFDIPANACAISAALQFQCPSFDVNSACSSFVVDIHVAHSLLNSGAYKKIAVFNPERYSMRINYGDRASAVLFGDGCTAGYLEAGGEEKGLRLIDSIIHSDPAKFETVKIPDGDCFSQHGSAVQKFAITRTIEATKAILDRNGLKPEDLGYFAGHQANLRMVESAAARLGIPKGRHLFNVDLFGNQGSAGAPAVLSMNWHKFQPGDYVAIAVVGSGLTWGAALFQMH